MSANNCCPKCGFKWGKLALTPEQRRALKELHQKPNLPIGFFKVKIRSSLVEKLMVTVEGDKMVLTELGTLIATRGRNGEE